MPYYGKQIIQRSVVSLVAVHWPNKKVEATATFCGESNRFLGALHDNFGDDGEIRSRDCGLAQINISRAQIGSGDEERLRTESLVESEYMNVARYNVKRAYELYDEPWVFPDGMHEKRQWQPWVAYRSGWAIYPEFFCIHRDPITHEPVMPFAWVPTGRYLHQAIRGVANWHLVMKKDLDGPGALAEAERLASLYKVTKGELAFDSVKLVYWKYPPMPTELPATIEEARAAYPVKNDGRSLI